MPYVLCLSCFYLITLCMHIFVRRSKLNIWLHDTAVHDVDQDWKIKVKMSSYVYKTIHLFMNSGIGKKIQAARNLLYTFTEDPISFCHPKWSPIFARSYPWAYSQVWRKIAHCFSKKLEYLNSSYTNWLYKLN